jgi:hypothetical protein
LVLLSRASVDRPWVLVEIGAALAFEKLIVPITDKLSPSEMPAPIREYKAIDLNDFGKYLAQLRKRAGKRNR